MWSLPYLDSLEFHAQFMNDMDAPYEPDERQRRLTEEASAAVVRNRQEGVLVSAELGRRMQDEATAAALADTGRPPRLDPTRQGPPLEFYVKLCAEIEETLSPDDLLHRLGDGFLNAAIFRRRPYLLAVECSIRATSLVAARIEVERSIQRVFPEAKSVDMEGYPASLIASLNGLSEDGVLSASEFDHDMSTLHRLGATGGGNLGLAPHADGTSARDLQTFWIEATVFEILTHVDHVHLRAVDERIFVITPSTPVLRGTQQFSEGQLYRLLVTKQQNAVVRAELIPEDICP